MGIHMPKSWPGTQNLRKVFRITQGKSTGYGTSDVSSILVSVLGSHMPLGETPSSQLLATTCNMKRLMWYSHLWF
jgi:hypothetical protein